MSEDIRRKTGSGARRILSRRIPLETVVPLKRADFAMALSYAPTPKPAAFSVEDQAETLPVRQTQKNDDRTAKLQPVYAAGFHGGKTQDGAAVRKQPMFKNRAENLAVDTFPLPVYEAPEDRRLVVKPRNWFKFTVRFVAGGIAAVFLFSGFFAWHSYSRASAGLPQTASSAAILSATAASPEKLTKEGDGRINVLLLGIGGEGHAGADLSDTIVLASIDPVNKTTSLLSVPRDLWVEMPNQYFGSRQKINAVYSAGKYKYYQQHGKTDEKAAVQAGLTALDGVMEQVLGVPIHYHAVIDFTAFKQAVDAVGGIDVDVKTALVDPTMAWENGGNPTLAKAGIQQMDGATALRYVRSRHTSSDFARSIRQREILVALRKKILTTGTLANPVKIQQLVATFGQNVFTDISTVDTMRLYGIVNGIDESSITSLDLVSGDHALVMTDTVGSTSVVRPKLGFDRYSDIQTYVRSKLRDGYLAKENAGIFVVGNSQGAADGVKTMLAGLGYNVLSTQVNPSLAADKTAVVDMSNGLSPYTRHYLEKRFGSNFTEKIPDGLVVPDGTQFVILVGK